VHFYELHEGDDDAYSDVILERDEAIEPEAFFDLVQEIRRRVQDTHEEDTLIEAIAAELERDHGFVYVSDERLAAAVNVSADEEDNYLIVGEDEFAALGLEGTEYRGVVADLEDGPPPSRLH